MQAENQAGKTIVITGASGVLGRQLVSRLVSRGYVLLLVGRDQGKLSLKFPGIACCGYEDIINRAKGYDTLIHLAVLNNNADAKTEDFDRVNVDLLGATLSAAEAAGIGRFINVTTFHALDGHGSSYAASKRRALEVSLHGARIQVINLFLPAVYGDEFTGKLSKIKNLPIILQRPALMFLTAFVPALSIDRLTDFVVQNLMSPSYNPDRNIFLSDFQSGNYVYRILRRFLDLVFVAFVAFGFWWLLLVVWAAVKIDSPGPGIFAQIRIGKGGRTFTCYKFRTMRRDTVQAGTHEVAATSITRVGAIIRKTKIDELPQIWNIVKNEVGLVGPRPCLPVQADLIRERSKRGVLDLVPGITGLAQINKIDMSTPEKLAQWDRLYLARRSILLDLKIAIQTVRGKGMGDNVSRDA